MKIVTENETIPRVSNSVTKTPEKDSHHWRLSTRLKPSRRDCESPGAEMLGSFMFAAMLWNDRASNDQTVHVRSQQAAEQNGIMAISYGVASTYEAEVALIRGRPAPVLRRCTSVSIRII